MNHGDAVPDCSRRSLKACAHADHVGVEAQLGHQRDAREARHGGAQRHTLRMALEEAPPGPAKAKVLGVELVGIDRQPAGEQRGEESQGLEDDDEHSGSGDQPELGDAAIVGGDEDEEADGGRAGTDRQGAPYALGGPPQGARMVVAAAQQIAVAHAQVDAEVDAEADEEHREGHGNEVEVADGGGREGGGPDEADQQGRDRGDDQGDRAQRVVEDAHDDGEAEDARNADVPRDPDQLFVVEGRVARHPYRHATLLAEPEFACRSADPVEGLAGGEDVVEVEHRVDDDDPARHGVDGGALEDQLLPGDCDGIFAVDLHGGVADPVEDGGPLVALRSLVPCELQTFLNQRREVGETRIALDLRDDGLDPGHLVAEVVQVLDAAIEQAVALEELRAAGRVDVREVGALLCEVGGEGVGGRARGFGRAAVDHDEERVLEIGEELREGLVVPARGKVLRDQPHVVGVDAQLEDRIGARRQGGEQDRDDYELRSPLNASHPARDPAAEQRLESRVYVLLAHGLVLIGRWDPRLGGGSRTPTWMGWSRGREAGPPLRPPPGPASPCRRPRAGSCASDGPPPW